MAMKALWSAVTWVVCDPLRCLLLGVLLGCFLTLAAGEAGGPSSLRVEFAR